MLSISLMKDLARIHIFCSSSTGVSALSFRVANGYVAGRVDAFSESFAEVQFHVPYP